MTYEWLEAHGRAGLAEDAITQDGRNFRIKIGYRF